MKIILTEEQYNTLKSNFLNESEELNQYGLTDSEMSEVEKIAEKETNDGLERLKSNIKELEEEVYRLSNYDYSKIGDERVREHIIKDFVEPKKKELEKLKKGLENFNFEEWKKRSMEWHIYSAGGLGWSFRYNRYREETLKRTLTKNDIIDLFVTALEGGSNYWYHMDLPDNIKSFGDSISKAVGEYILQGGYIEFYDVEEYDRILRDKERGDYNIQGDVEDEKSFNEDLEETKLGYVDMDKILEAITIIKKDYPKVWDNILLENADAADADVFLQLCVMGEIVFG